MNKNCSNKDIRRYKISSTYHRRYEFINKKLQKVMSPPIILPVMINRRMCSMITVTLNYIRIPKLVIALSVSQAQILTFIITTL